MRPSSLKHDLLISFTLLLTLLAVLSVAAVSSIGNVWISYGLLLTAWVLGGVFAVLAARRLVGLHSPDAARLNELAHQGHVSADLDGLLVLADRGCDFESAFRAASNAQIWVDGSGRVAQISDGFSMFSAEYGAALAQTYPGFTCEQPHGIALNSLIGDLSLPAGDSPATLVLRGREDARVHVLITPMGSVSRGRSWLVEFQVQKPQQPCMSDAVDALLEGALTQVHLEKLTERQKQVIASLESELRRGRDMAEETANAIAALANGNLSLRVSRRGGGQTMSALTLVNSAIDRLATIIRSLREGAEKLSETTLSVSNGAKVIAERTVQQAQSLEQTSTSMAQIAASAQNACDHADHASKLASSARQSAESGGHIAASAIDAMGKIEESSSRITQIVGLIDDIAFQTNLLALNAAVEAARAGDAGKGFAVVASEVRSLAQRTSQASREIKDLIVNSRGSVSTGVDLVRATDEELSKIAHMVSELDQMMSQVAQASRQQAGGISEVAQAISQMDQITQQNATLVDTTMLALEKTHTQIEDFRSVMLNERYKPAPLYTGGAAHSASAPAEEKPATTGLSTSMPPRRSSFSSVATGVASSQTKRQDARHIQKDLHQRLTAVVQPASASKPLNSFGSAAQALLVHEDEWDEF